VFSWSGGNDSALALLALRERGWAEPVALLTTVTEGYERVSMHGVRRQLVRSQSAVVGVALVEVEIPPQCSNDVYEARMAAAFTSTRLLDIEEIAFGDLFLEDIRAYRESRLAAVGKRGQFPLWGRDTHELAHPPMGSARSSFASIRACWIAPLQAASTTSGCSPTCRRTSTRAGRTASSTPSSTPGRSSARRCAASAARPSSATALSSTTFSSRAHNSSRPTSARSCHDDSTLV
jgi:hypothetical protein